MNDTTASSGAAEPAPAVTAAPAVPAQRTPPSRLPDTTIPESPPDGEDLNDGVRRAAHAVLARQDGRHVAQVHIDTVLALATGTPVHEATAGERRVAAVAAVLSGHLTRGKTARRMGQRSQDIAHWVRRHLEGMPLLIETTHGRTPPSP